VSRKPYGLSIAEALVTLGLVVFVFSLTAGLLQSYIRTTKFADAVDKAMETNHIALSEIRKEAKQAVSVLSPPSSGESSGVLTFEKVFWADPARLPDVSAPFPLSWEPQDLAWVDRLTYERRSSRLLRTSLKEELSSVVCADLVDSFQVRFLTNGNLALELALRHDGISRKFSSQVYLGLLR
jgi:hypothetical protein